MDNELVTKGYLRDEFTRFEKRFRADFRTDIRKDFDNMEHRLKKELGNMIETKVEETVGRYTGIMIEHFQSILQGVTEVSVGYGQRITNVEESIDKNIKPRLRRLEIAVA